MRRNCRPRAYYLLSVGQRNLIYWLNQNDMSYNDIEFRGYADSFKKLRQYGYAKRKRGHYDYICSLTKLGKTITK